MPLTPQEELELKQLEKEVGQVPSKPDLQSLINDPRLKELAEGYPKAMVASLPAPGIAKLLGKVGEMTGLSKIPDKLMQVAVGMKKYQPGVGSSLINQGLMGTKNQLAGQVGSKLAQEEATLANAVKSIPGQVESSAVGKEVQNLAKPYQTSSGTVPSSVEPEFNKINQAASEISSRGPVSPQEALELKRIAGRVGYKEGEPLAKTISKIAQSEAKGYKQGLSKAYEQVNPAGPNIVEESLGKESALLQAKRGLSKPESLAYKDPIRLLLGRTVGSPLAMSTTAQATSKGPRLVTEAALRLSALKPEEHDELSQLEAELRSQGIDPDQIK